MTDDETTRPDILDSGFKLSPLIKQVLAESDVTSIDELATEVFELIKPHDRPMALFQALRTMVRESWRPAFIPTQQTVRTEQVAQSAPAPERDGRQWLAADGRLLDTREDVERAEANALESEAAQAVADGEMTEDEARAAVRSIPVPGLNLHPDPSSGVPVRQAAASLPQFTRPTPIRPQRPVTPPPAPRPQASPKVAAIREAWRKALRQRIATGAGHKFLGDCTVPDLEFAADQREQHAKRTQARADQLRTLAGLMRDHDARTLSDVPAEVLASMSETLTEAAA